MDDLLVSATAAAFDDVEAWHKLPADVKMRHCRGMKRALAVVAEWLENELDEWGPANAIRQQIGAKEPGDGR